MKFELRRMKEKLHRPVFLEEIFVFVLTSLLDLLGPKKKIVAYFRFAILSKSKPILKQECV